MRTGKGLCSIVGVSLVGWILAPGASAFKIPTHQDLNLRSASVSTLGAILLSELGVRGGLTEEILGKSIQNWIRDGGAAEDEYFGSETLGAVNRSKHHFHNPLLGWDIAGLDGRCATPFRGQASVRWAQTTDQVAQALESATWADARRQFRDFLTLGTRGDRDEAGAQMFRILGQQVHLIADLAVPAHVRNEIHCTRTAEGFEVWAATGFALGLIQGLRSEDVVRPDPAIFAIPLPAGELVATVPVVRLWDSDQYDRTNPDVTRRPTIGLAEYTNANFFSGKTIFSPDFPFPARTSVDLLEPPEPEPKRGELRRYLTKVRDGVTVNHLAVPSALYEFLPDALKDKKIGLDDKVYRDYAQLLFPRAVGYSAALLDYFFRGKLDVDVFSDDGSTLQLRGTNASTDPLVDGTLKLYADVPTLDPSGTVTTVRRELTALGDSAVRGVDPGQALSSALFEPQEAERFLAVYQGRLGNEIPVPNPDTPTLSFPGGVIGKVLGGVRVEEVFLDFADGGKWKLRTPRGIFPLKVEGRDAWLAYPAVEDLRWGDGQDQLVGRTAFGPGQPNQIVAYTVPRQPSSVELATETTPEGLLVRLRVIAEQAFPFGLPLGTTVNISHTIEYQQQLVSYDRTVVFQWTEPPGLPGQYVFTEEKFGPTRLTTVANETFRFADSFAVTLDLAHYSQFTSPTDRASYGWTLTEVGLTAAGQLVGVIRVNLAAPPFFRWPVVSQPVYGLDATGARVVLRRCGTFVCFDETVGLRRTFPGGVDPLLWAVVDLRTGQVLGKTAEDALTITSREAMEAPRWAAEAAGPAPLVYHQEIEERVGGDSEGTTVRGWFAEAVRAWDLQAFSTQTELTLRVSTEQNLAGLLRGEVSQALSQLGFLQAGLGRPAPPPTFLAFGPFGPDQKVLKVITPASGLFSPLATVEVALRARAASGPERLVLLTQGDVVGQGTFNGIVAWDPSGPQARGLLKSRMGFEEQGLSLGSATKNLAIINNAFVEGGGYLVALDGASPPRFVPDPDGLFFYVALEPQYVYSVATERFHSARVTAEGITELRPTVLPLVLQNGPGGPIGDYHAIRLP